jgi:hypothetical protein
MGFIVSQACQRSKWVGLKRTTRSMRTSVSNAACWCDWWTILSLMRRQCVIAALAAGRQTLSSRSPAFIDPQPRASTRLYQQSSWLGIWPGFSIGPKSK